MSDKIIMENKSAKLYKDRFYFEGETYPISNMENAVMRSGWFQNPIMEITFKDKTIMEFNVGTSSASSALNTLFSGFMVDATTQDLQTSTQQWVTAINMLIALG